MFLLSLSYELLLPDKELLQRLSMTVVVATLYRGRHQSSKDMMVSALQFEFSSEPIYQGELSTIRNSFYT